MNKVMKELKKPKVLLALMILMIYVLSKEERREGYKSRLPTRSEVSEAMEFKGFSRRQSKGGIRCMVGDNNELQCNTFEAGGSNRKEFACTKGSSCKVKGGGEFKIPRLDRTSGDDIMETVLIGLGYKK